MTIGALKDWRQNVFKAHRALVQARQISSRASILSTLVLFRYILKI